MTSAGASVPSEIAECRCRSLGPSNLCAAATILRAYRAPRRPSGRAMAPTHPLRAPPLLKSCPGSSPRVARVLRVVGIVVALACAAGALVLTWPQLLKLERTYPFAQTVAFRGIGVAVCGALCLVLLLLAIIRPVRPLALALAALVGIAAAGGGAVLMSRGMGTDALPAKGANSVRVLTWNT